MKRAIAISLTDSTSYFSVCTRGSSSQVHLMVNDTPFEGSTELEGAAVLGFCSPISLKGLVEDREVQLIQSEPEKDTAEIQ